LLKESEPADAAVIRGLITDLDPELRRRLRPHLEKTGSLEYAWQCAKRHAKQARTPSIAWPTPTPSRCCDTWPTMWCGDRRDPQSVAAPKPH